MDKISLAEKLSHSLDEKFAAAINLVSECAEKFGAKAYIIGGVVRDLILSKPIFDIDIVIEGNAIDFCRAGEKENLWQIKRISEEFGTVKILLHSGIELDIASTRTEGYPRAGHLPVVEKIGCTLKEDISRRDFTVNALVLSLNKGNFGEVTDYLSGLDDIKKKQLRILHDKSFIDDPTRIIRALRFKHKLDFSIEPHTYSLMCEYLSAFNKEDICYERIKQVSKLAFNLNSEKLFDEFTQEKIYKLISNDIRSCTGKNISKAINTNSDKIDKNNVWLIYLACLITPECAEKLNLSAKEKEILTAVDRLLAQTPKFSSNFDVYKFFENSPIESVIAYIAITSSTKAQKYLDKLREIKTIITGNTLMKLGFKEGKDIGATLNKILEAKINGQITTEKEETEFAQKLLNK